MPIATRCPHCKAKLKGPDKLVGHTLKCPGCGAPVLITADFLVPTAAPRNPAIVNNLPAPGPAVTPKPSGKPTTNAAKSPIYDDLEVIEDETADAASAKTEEAAPVRPPQKPQPPSKPAPQAAAPNPPTKKPVTAPAPAKNEAAAPKRELAKTAPAQQTQEPKPLLPNMELDRPAAPSSPTKPPSEDAPRPNRAAEKPPAPSPDFGANNLFMDDGEIKLQDDGDDIKLQSDGEEHVPLMEVKDEDVFDDFEVIEEKRQEVVELEVAPAGAEEVTELEVVEDNDVPELALAEDVDDLEEVDDQPGADSPFSFTLLKPSVIFVQGQSGMFSVNNAYDLLNGRTKKRLGEALEKKDDAATVLRLFVGNNFVPTRIEVLEGRQRDLVLTIRRPPHLWTSKAEILDADDQLLGSFEIQPFSALMSKPVWISDHNGKKIAKMKAMWMQGKCVYSTPDDKKLAETMSQAVYEQRIVLRWAPRGGSFYITFTKLAEKKSRHKLLLLGVVLGIDLFYTQNQRGPIIGGRRF
jgi:hypothetical protein